MNSMEQNISWEANNCSASKVPHLYGTMWSIAVFSSCGKSVPMLSHVNLFHALKPYFLKIHHHHWLNSPMWALAFLRSFCQLKYLAIASSDFATRVFSRLGLSAPRPTPGYPRGPMLSVRVVSLS
jgi:hypothetical protein